MNHTTQGIVLDYIKYSEHGIIVRLYTLHFGLHSYLVRGVRKQKRASIGAFQPLVFLQVVLNHKTNRTLHYLKEVHIQPQSYCYEAAKQAHKLLIVEVLKYVLESYDHPKLDSDRYNFLIDSLRIFHTCSAAQAWVFMAQFLAKLSIHVGIFLIHSPLQAACVTFDSKQGIALARWVQVATEAAYLADMPVALARPAVHFFIYHYGCHFGQTRGMRRVMAVLQDYF